MLQKFGKRVMNNFGLKILAVLFAVVLWIVVVNIDDPSNSKPYTTSVSLENKSYITSMGKWADYLDGKNTITFSVYAKRSVHNTLTNANFTATADAQKIEYDEKTGTYRVPVVVLPLIATSVMQSLYSLFDILIAGRFLGSAGISGINNSSQVLGIVNTVVIGLSMGGTILIGRLFGQGEKSKMQNASNTFINSFFIMGIIMSVVLYFVSPMIITLMKTPAYNEAVSYFKVCAIGVFFTFCYNALSGVMRAVGNSKMPMYCIFVSTTVNIVLDIIFMGVIKLGTAGAALATVIAQGISFFMALGFVLKQKDMWTSLKIYGNVLGKIIKIGFPCLFLWKERKD